VIFFPKKRGEKRLKKTETYVSRHNTIKAEKINKQSKTQKRLKKNKKNKQNQTKKAIKTTNQS